MLKEIYNRQSIRKYKDQKVETEKVELLLRAAMNAPTARNLQTWRFLVIENREALDTMTDLKSHTAMMKTAPLAILVMGDLSKNEDPGYLYMDASAAIENILIEAVHLGLGTCWCAIAPNNDRIEAFKDYYQLEDHLLPIGVVAVGYSDEGKELIDRYDRDKVAYYK